jgi:hypothetical protein
MSQEGKNPLTKWLTKAKDIPAPPAASERRGRPPGSKGSLRQLNLKVSGGTYARFKGLAYRDRLSGVALIDLMLDLYEKERGTLENKPR